MGESRKKEENKSVKSPKKALREIVVVEGKYDKIKVESLFDATIIITGGFSIFRDREKSDMIRRLAQKRGVIILTDSDRAGFLIRNYIKNICHGCKVYHAYTPDIVGKERRKAMPSKEGTLGVEGIAPEIISKAILQAAPEETSEKGEPITKSDLYEVGLSGREESATRRNALLDELSLPHHLSSNGMLSVFNALWSREEFLNLIIQREQKWNES